MKKNKFVRRGFCLFVIVAVVLFAGLLILNTIASNLMYYKIKSICKSSFNCSIKMNKPHVDILRGEIVLKNIFIDRSLTDSKFHASVEDIFIRINIGGALKGRIVLEDVNLNKLAVQSYIKNNMLSGKDSQKDPGSLIIGVVASYLLGGNKGGGTFDDFVKAPDLLNRFSMKNASINQAKVEINSDDGIFLSIENLDTQISNVFYYPAQLTDIFLNINFGQKEHVKVVLEASVDLNSSKGDFSLEIKCSDIDIADVIRQYAETPIYVKEGTADISLVGTCQDGRLDFSQRVLTKDLFLDAEKEQDLDKEVFFLFTYRDILDYVRAKKGKVDINFNIKGTLKEPEINLSPNILTEIMLLKISSGL